MSRTRTGTNLPAPHGRHVAQAHFPPRLRAEFAHIIILQSRDLHSTTEVSPLINIDSAIAMVEFKRASPEPPRGCRTARQYWKLDTALSAADARRYLDHKGVAYKKTSSRSRLDVLTARVQRGLPLYDKDTLQGLHLGGWESRRRRGWVGGPPTRSEALNKRPTQALDGTRRSVDVAVAVD